MWDDSMKEEFIVLKVEFNVCFEVNGERNDRYLLSVRL